MIARYLFSHALTLVSVVASLVMVVRLLGSRRTAQSTFAWLLAIVFLPFVAIPLYLLLGQRKFPRRAKGPTQSRLTPVHRAEPGEPAVASLLRQSGVSPARPGNSFELLVTGEDAYQRLLALIASAQRSIDLTIFILADDEVGQRVVSALCDRAAEGVAVRVIVDAVGSSRAERWASRVLHAAGAELRVFMPLRHSPIRGRTNLRSHRKLVIFDAECVFTGGMNLAQEYMGLPLPAASAEARFRDVAAVASGPIAIDATALFESDWAFCGGKARAPAPRPISARGDALLQIVPSGPDMRSDTVYDAFLIGIFAAREQIVLVTPYYIPDEALQHALVLAARRGVRTEVIVPSRSNHRIADVARRRLLRELSAAGVAVRYYPHGMVHAKALVIDAQCAYVGSPNFDMRSLFLNYENALFVYSPEAIASIGAFLALLRSESVSDGPADHSSWLVEQVAWLLAPEL